MVDSIGSASVYLSSDSELDPRCEPCAKQEKQRKPTGYCPICGEFFCDSCLVTHGMFSITENHDVLTGDDMPKSMCDKPVKYEGCAEHNGENKDRFCFDHKSIICGVCVVRKHPKCMTKPVSEACKSFNLPDEEIAFSKNVDTFLKYVKSADSNVESSINKLESQSQKFQTDAQVQRDKLIKQIHQSFQDFCTVVKDTRKGQKSLLSTNKLAVAQIVTDVISISQTLKQSRNTRQSDQTRFLNVQKNSEKVKLLEDKMQSLDIKGVDMNCSFNMQYEPLDDSRNKFGDISYQTTSFLSGIVSLKIEYPFSNRSTDTDQTASGPSGAAGGGRLSSMKLAMKDKFNVNLSDDTRDCYITGLDMTVDGNVLLADLNNSRVKLFSPTGQLLSSLKLPEKPWDVSVINQSEAAISMCNQQIGIIDIADSTQLSLGRVIRTENYVHGIKVYNNHLVVTCSSGGPFLYDIVQMIDMKGKVVWTVTKDTQGNNLFQGAHYLTTRRGISSDTVVVTDLKQTITVLDAPTGEVVKVCSVRGKEPPGVTVDDHGNIYVCYTNGEISVWSGDVAEERSLVSGRESLENPWALAYDHRRSELLITSGSTKAEFRNFIHRYKIH